jgi:hypothetical protein
VMTSAMLLVVCSPLLLASKRNIYSSIEMVHLCFPFHNGDQLLRICMLINSTAQLCPFRFHGGSIVAACMVLISLGYQWHMHGRKVKGRLTWTNERAENSQRIPSGEPLYRSWLLIAIELFGTIISHSRCGPHVHGPNSLSDVNTEVMYVTITRLTRILRSLNYWSRGESSTLDYYTLFTRRQRICELWALISIKKIGDNFIMSK